MGESITYLNHGRDLAYSILFLAASKIGYKICMDGFLRGLQTDFSTTARRYIRPEEHYRGSSVAD